MVWLRLVELRVITTIEAKVPDYLAVPAQETGRKRRRSSNRLSVALSVQVEARGRSRRYVIHPTGVVVWRGDTEQIKGIVDALLTDVKEPKDVQEWLKKIEEARASR